MSELRISVNDHCKVSLTILSRIRKYTHYFYEINYLIFTIEYIPDSNNFMTADPEHFIGMRTDYKIM